MDIKLSWVNPNQVYDEIKVFRSESPIDKQNLPEPIATLTQIGVNEFVDTGLVQGNRYYYALRIAYGTDYIVSDAIATQALHYTGPLGQELLFGDMDLGYFGYGTNSEFLPSAQYQPFFNNILTAGTWTNVNHVWHKFAYKGKILIVPGGAIKYNLSWNQLYNAGLVYGDDIPEWEVGGVDQNVKITVGQDVFKVRLFKGSDSRVLPSFSSWIVTANSTHYIYNTTLSNPNGEYFDIMNNFCFANDGRIPYTDIGASFNLLSNNYLALLQDCVGEENSLNKAMFGVNLTISTIIGGYHVGRYPFRPLAGASIPKGSSTVNVSGNRYGTWMPVFELEV